MSGNSHRKTTVFWISIGGILLFLANYSIILFRANYSTIRQEKSSEQLLPATYKVHQEDAKLSEWEKAIGEADVLLSKRNSSKTAVEGSLPSCLLPDKRGTAALVQRALTESEKSRNNTKILAKEIPFVPLPVVNMGMPKCGSTTLYGFFNCTGYSTTHWNIDTHDFEGLCMRDAVKVGLPPIATCASKVDALMQIDIGFPFGYQFPPYFDKKNPRNPVRKNFIIRRNRDDCFFPQLSVIEEIHKESPNATFVMNFRPIDDWIKSIIGWGDLLPRFRECDLPNLPRGIPKDLSDAKDTRDVLERFLCSHVLHVRNFVKSHPSHALIELDLYDTEGSSLVLSTLFPSRPGRTPSSECWGHSNKSGSRKKNPSKESTNKKKLSKGSTSKTARK